MYVYVILLFDLSSYTKLEKVKSKENFNYRIVFNIYVYGNI